MRLPASPAGQQGDRFGGWGEVHGEAQELGEIAQGIVLLHDRMMKGPLLPRRGAGRRQWWLWRIGALAAPANRAPAEARVTL